MTFDLLPDISRRVPGMRGLRRRTCKSNCRIFGKASPQAPKQLDESGSPRPKHCEARRSKALHRWSNYKHEELPEKTFHKRNYPTIKLFTWELPGKRIPDKAFHKGITQDKGSRQWMGKIACERMSRDKNRGDLPRSTLEALIPVEVRQKENGHSKPRWEVAAQKSYICLTPG